MEDFENFLKNPEIEVSHYWGSLVKEEEDEKKDEWEAGVELVAKAFLYLQNDLVGVSDKIKNLTEELNKLQKRVTDKSRLATYHRELSLITSTFNASQKQYFSLVSAWNKSKSLINRIEKTPKRNEVVKYREKFEKLRPDLNEMLSRVNQYQMTLIQTRKMMMDLSKDDEKMILFRDLETLEPKKEDGEILKAKKSAEKTVRNKTATKIKASEGSKSKITSNPALSSDKKKQDVKVKSKEKKSSEI